MELKEAVISLSIQLEVKRRLGKDYEAKALLRGIEALQRQIKEEALAKADGGK